MMAAVQTFACVVMAMQPVLVHPPAPPQLSTTPPSLQFDFNSDPNFLMFCSAIAEFVRDSVNQPND